MSTHTGAHNTTYSSRDTTRNSIFDDWPYVAPGMVFILAGAAICVAVMSVAERYFVT